MGPRSNRAWFHYSVSDNVEMVKAFLRGQNMEQIGRLEDAIELYESTVSGRFDSTGPYDRLIALYSGEARHADVIRIAEAALTSVHTYEAKKAWYERMRDDAIKAQKDAVPQAAPKER
jgi:tetratricopeptide (TPR) repeat protein